MPQVYKGSEVMPEALAKIPYDGEQEMLEQGASVDLSGDVHVERELFCAWLEAGQTPEESYPCASAVMRYAFDQQGVDFRGVGWGNWRHGVGIVLQCPFPT